MLQKHNNSLYQLLSNVYTEHEWIPWKFTKTPKGFWNDTNNQRSFVQALGKELGINEMSDWYKVKAEVYLLLNNYLIVRTLMNLEEQVLFNFTRIHLALCYPLCILITSGYHGNSLDLLYTFGKTREITEYTWTG